jgi:CDP-paratose 2-epimerase
MRILITGACGFVGNTLARGLKAGWPGWEVIGLDNLVRAGSEMNRAALRQSGIRLFHGDIRNRSDLDSIPRCDWILDAAANPSVLAGVDGKTSSRQLVEHNLVGTVNLLELARNWNGGFLMLSTSRVYSIHTLATIPVETRGDRFTPPANAGTISGLGPRGVTEDFSTEPPLSLYGSSKRCSELLACEYADAFGLPVWINRCGVLAGAGQFGKIDQGIFSFWIHAWRANHPLKYLGFNGTGHQVRDCLHARDLLPLIALQLQKPAIKKERRIVNAGGGITQSASLRELSAWCARRWGAREVIAEKETRPFDVPWLVLDSSLAQEVWNWQPQTPLESIWTEIAGHAEQHPHWLDITLDS